MNEYTGWLLDLYHHPEKGIVIWLLCDDGQRRCLHHDFSVTFYAAAPSRRLRDLWEFLKNQPIKIELSRTERKDLIKGATVVLAAKMTSSFALQTLFQTLTNIFPDVNFYDADVQVALRHAAQYETFPLARCQVFTDEQNKIHEINVLDSKWDIDYEAAPLRVLTIEPDADPFHKEPQKIFVRSKRDCSKLDLKDEISTLAFLSYLLKRNDPDLIISSHGDTWLLPLLLNLSEKHNRPLPWNRDPNGQVYRKKKRSYFAYNQVIYRGDQIHLAGRLHIDTHNTVMYGDYGIDGVLEMARVTSLPIQTAARVSPGTGISAMQIVTAMEDEILVPYVKEQVEKPKTTSELFEADKGGIIYDPIIGVHEDVGEIDFFSMYPSIMVHFNISPETVGDYVKTAKAVANLHPLMERDKVGLIPKTLAPLLEKRYKIKSALSKLSKPDCRYKNYKARAAAHKWLLVTCFGYLGYKNARFGRIEAHEAVVAYGTEVMLRAKEIAEEMGFRVLHMYVDGIWLEKAGCKSESNFQSLLEAIKSSTGLYIALEGVYKWVAFLPSCQNEDIAVPNRYFGVFQNGVIKTRGIETRRHDTPEFIRDAQTEILEILAKAPNRESLKGCLPEIRTVIYEKQDALRSRCVPPEKLIIHQTMSKYLEDYRTPVPAFSALQELQDAGKPVCLGQTIKLIYTLGNPRAHAWDGEIEFDLRRINIPRYRSLLDRAVDTVTEPITGKDKSWLNQVRQLQF